MSLLINILLVVGIIYLIIQSYKDIKDIFKDDNEQYKN